MKIVLVEFTPGGGLFQFAFQLGGALAREGHHVTLLCGQGAELRSTDPLFEVADVLPTWQPGSTGGDAAWFHALRRVTRAARYVVAWGVTARELRRRRPEVVQWAGFRFALDAPLFAVAHAVTRRSVHADLCHQPQLWGEQRGAGMVRSGGVLARGMRFVHERQDVVFVLGDQAAAQVRRQWPGVRRVEVIPHGDEGIFGSAGDVAPVSTTGPTVLFFGTLAAYKGVDALLRIAPLLVGAVPEVRILVVGDPSREIDLADLEKRAADAPGVELHCGYVPVGEVAGWFGRARVVVAPYRAAFQSGVIHLAQTFGRPVVATDVGDLAAGVGEGGTVVPLDDDRALADALVDYLADASRAAQVGDRGRAQVSAGRSWADVARRELAVLEEVAGSRDRPA